MSRSIQLVLVSLIAWGGASVAEPARAHGWNSHQHGFRHPPRRALLPFSYAPRYGLAGLNVWPWGCQLRRSVTRYGTLVYREVCF